MTRDLTLRHLTDKLAAVSDLYVARTGIVRDRDWHALKLAEEIGELIAEHLRATGRGRGATDDAAERVGDEAADVLGHLLLFCRDASIDIEAALERKWLKHIETVQ